jgi:hypothetical protein
LQITNDCGGPAKVTLEAPVPAFIKLENDKLKIEPILISQVAKLTYKIKAVWKGGPDTTQGEQTIDIQFEPDCAKRKWKPVIALGTDHVMLVG